MHSGKETSVLLGALAGIVFFGAAAIAPRLLKQTAGAEPTIAAPTATATNQEKEQILQGLTAYFTTLYHIEIAQELLKTPGLDMNVLSLEEQMQKQGSYFLGGFETWGTVARSGTTGENGTSIKRVPSPDNEQFPPVEGVPPETKLSWIAEISVVNPDGSINTFGLSTNPQITKSLEKLEGPDVLVVRDPYSQRDIYCRIEPRYLRLERQNPDGSITRFVNREERQTFEDGSTIYEKGVIGASPAEIQELNGK